MYAGGLIVACIAMLQAATVTWLAYDQASGLGGATVKALVNLPTFAIRIPLAVFVGAASVASGGQRCRRST